MGIGRKEKGAKSREYTARRRGKSITLRVFFTLFYALCSLLVAIGCASVSQKEPVMAVVDGEQITEEDLKYALNITHRREDLSSAGVLKFSQYVQKLVDDRLIANEARVMGMNKLPEVQQAIDAYILRESVVRLYNEEIVQKITVTEKEIKDYYNKNYKGKEASDKEFNDVKGRIEKGLMKQKEKERSNEYLKYLRERANIKIEKNLLSAINLDGDKEETEKWSKDTRQLAEVNGSVLTAGDFMAITSSSFMKSKDDIINIWVERKLVDHEALRRNYKAEPVFQKMVYRYENQLLKNTFIKRTIVPQITVSEKNLEEYYSQHQRSFLKPVRFKMQQITVKSPEEAQEILKSLENGADFSWLAKRKSIDAVASTGGDAGWSIKSELPKPVQEVIDTLKAGDISPVIVIDSLYMIIRIMEKTGEEAEKYDMVKDVVYKAYVNNQVDTLLKKYINQLKEGARITINNEAIRALEEKFKQ